MVLNTFENEKLTGVEKKDILTYGLAISSKLKFQLNNSIPFFLVLSLQFCGIFSGEQAFKHWLELHCKSEEGWKVHIHLHW